MHVIHQRPENQTVAWGIVRSLGPLTNYRQLPLSSETPEGIITL